MNSKSNQSTELKLRANRWAATLSVKPRLIRVQKMKRKWGSCSAGSTVTFATDLVNQNPDFQDFVIAHELLHLRVPNHGRLFKTLMTAHVPRWRDLDIGRRLGCTNSPSSLDRYERARHKA
jgi:predicted metal-dependent hydrolase